MADDIGVVVTGDRRVSLRFEEFPAKAHDSLLSRITSLTDELEARVKSAVPKRTGQLESHVNLAVYDDKTRITGRVFIDGDYAKAAALEYGAHGSAKVGAHDARLDHMWSLKLSDPIIVMVGAHSRQLDLVARRFLRDPIAEMTPEIEASLLDAVNAAIQDGEK